MSSPISFLIIEDEPSNRHVMIDKFTTGSQTDVLDSASSVNEAFDKIIQCKPDALLP